MVAGETGKPWTNDEVDATVARYFDMLVMDVRGGRFVKESVYRELSARFPSRTVGSVGRKMSNVSAVLVGLGYPHLRGLAPLANYQHSLVDAVLQQLALRHSLDDLFVSNSVSSPIAAGPVDITRETPVPVDVVTDVLYGADNAAPYRRNYLELEARNAALGRAGELAVVRREQEFLRKCGKSKLADRVEHVAQTQGDGLGYDVLSFDAYGREKWIEVKTTKYAAEVPFFITRRELAVSRSSPENFHLYRLYAFGSRRGVGMYSLRGNLADNCSLAPVNFEAKPRGRSRLTVLS